MARPREFDASAAQDRILQAFWANGYESTSVDDLCRAAGLSKSSLYSAFGDKHELLVLSLDRYIDARLGHVRDIFRAASGLRAGLEAMCADIIDEIAAGPGRRGCFIGNCAAEIPLADRKAMARVRKGLAKLEGIFATALRRARAAGECPENVDIKALARFLVAAIHGLRLVGKVNPDRAALQSIARVMIDGALRTAANAS